MHYTITVEIAWHVHERFIDVKLNDVPRSMLIDGSSLVLIRDRILK